MLDTSHNFSAFLFDMDGTILRSSDAAERVWGAWAQRHGLDPEAFLPTMHGKRGIDTIRQLGLHGIDAEVEAAKITQAEIEDVDGIVAIAGAADFLSSIPPALWVIVTSSTRALALRRLEAAGLPVPQQIVTGDDVSAGKPDPQCYILGAKRAGALPSDCVVFEDVQAGVQAGEAAGSSIVVIAPKGKKEGFRGHTTIEDYTGVKAVVAADGKLGLSIGK